MPASKFILVTAPAKVNLYLGVHADKDERGYHRVDTVMTTLDLTDTLAIAPSDQLMVRTVPEADFPMEQNTAYRAAKAMGYHKVITYILESEPGTSLKAAGFHCEGRAGGLEWNGSRKPKDADQYPHEMKKRWSKEMEVATNAGKTGEVASI